MDLEAKGGAFMARILVTGGAGFIGCNLVRGFLDRGDEVVVIDNFSTGRRENLADVEDRIRLIEGSITDYDTVCQALEGVDGVSHQAALPSVPKSLDIPLVTNEANITGTLTLFEACRRMGVRRVVYAASSSAYGDHDAPRKHEGLDPRPKSPYAVQKLVGELYGTVYHELFGLETVGLRYFNVFGPRQNPNSQYAAVVPAFVCRMLAGESPTVYGDGLQSRDFTYIDNVIHANQAALAAPLSACGRSYNIACGESATLLELIDGINDILGTSIRPDHVAARAGDVRHSLADVSAATEAFGYQPRMKLNEALRLTVDWYRGREKRG